MREECARVCFGHSCITLAFVQFMDPPNVTSAQARFLPDGSDHHPRFLGLYRRRHAVLQRVMESGINYFTHVSLTCVDITL
jgi:hypothetical protein